MRNNSKYYSRKGSGSYLYKWKPEVGFARHTPTLNNGNPTTCNALPFSNGEDWVTTYSYNFVTDTIQHQYAYVACDYVQ